MLLYLKLALEGAVLPLRINENWQSLRSPLKDNRFQNTRLLNDKDVANQHNPCGIMKSMDISLLLLAGLLKLTFKITVTPKSLINSIHSITYS